MSDALTAIVIPARHASTRLPGKPLAKINGVSMLERVVKLAHYAARDSAHAHILVATEHEEILDHAKEIGAKAVLTDPECPTGSDRALEAIQQIKDDVHCVLNLQGDAPFTDPDVITKMLGAFKEDPQLEVVTPVHQLSWMDLDRLRESKKSTPFSGTTAILNKDKEAIWFSKNIIPAIRNEEDHRQNGDLSPVYQHIGLYGFRADILEKFCRLPIGHYETLEGLEQLRMLENNIRVKTIETYIEPGRIQSGIDTKEDIDRAEAFIKKFGDPLDRYNANS